MQSRFTPSESRKLRSLKTPAGIQRFLDEIGQYLPERGRVLDLGCGFGLFSLYYASVYPGLRVEGLDRNPRRIAMAQAVATLTAPNVSTTSSETLSSVTLAAFE